MVRDLIRYACDEMRCPEFEKDIRVEWSNRLTRCVGKAIFRPANKTGTIKLSSKLWSSMSNKDQDDTILHECAHLIADYLYGIEVINTEGHAGHGVTWKIIARRIGAKPTRYIESHKADFHLYRRRVARYNVLCKCGAKHALSKNMITRMRKTRYICKRCGSFLKAENSHEILYHYKILGNIHFLHRL